MPPFEVVDYGGIEHVYTHGGMAMVGYVVSDGRLFRRLRDGTFLETDALTVYAGSEGDAVDVLTAVCR